MRFSLYGRSLTARGTVSTAPREAGPQTALAPACSGHPQTATPGHKKSR